jgi:hypothetical protein
MRTRSSGRGALLAGVKTLCLAATICASLPVTALAGPAVHLKATLTPERLGQGTTIGFHFQIEASDGRVPPPLTGVGLLYPNNLGIALSGLGLETCSQATLEALGASGCPADSVMGSGSALAEVPIGPEGVTEGASITVLRAPDQEGHIALFLYTESKTPVLSQLVLPSLLLPASPPFGGRLFINVPLVPTVPGGADVSVLQISSTLGPENLTYTEVVHRRVVHYRPKGILLPDRCPRGGFAFAATLSFLDGSHTSAHTTVPCPHRRQAPTGRRQHR